MGATIYRDIINTIGDDFERFNLYYEIKLRWILGSHQRDRLKAYSQVYDRAHFKIENVTFDLQISALRFDPCRIRIKVEIVKIVTRIRLTCTRAKKDKKRYKGKSQKEKRWIDG